MDNSTVYASVIYLLTYRLAVLLLGGVCIYLGYRLFIQGFGRKESGTEKGGAPAELDAKFGDINLTLKSAAPGTFFALFGAVITSVILMGSPPEFVYSASKDGESLGVRGDAIGAETLHDQVWDIHYTGAVKLAEIVVKMKPSDPDFQDTLASLYYMDDRFSDAAASQEKALQHVGSSENASSEIDEFNRKMAFYLELAKASE